MPQRHLHSNTDSLHVLSVRNKYVSKQHSRTYLNAEAGNYLISYDYFTLFSKEFVVQVEFLSICLLKTTILCTTVLLDVFSKTNTLIFDIKLSR